MTTSQSQLRFRMSELAHPYHFSPRCSNVNSKSGARTNWPTPEPAAAMPVASPRFYIRDSKNKLRTKYTLNVDVAF